MFTEPFSLRQSEGVINFTGFVASVNTVLESHVHVLKQFEAAVALPSTGHVQVSVPWDTCSLPKEFPPLCRCVGLDVG